MKAFNLNQCCDELAVKVVTVFPNKVRWDETTMYPTVLVLNSAGNESQANHLCDFNRWDNLVQVFQLEAYVAAQIYRKRR
jgi:hypothetical protein